jgi:hypothetical protein
MKREIENISGKLDALTVSGQETKEEGKFPKLTNKLDRNDKLKIQ